ncbi:hypothetical protein M9Y10_016312 [Tritrichomonas musculus]|uniref:DBB domain-containing protein n=1 Tax=Tritrichomonas musculus TaxID=1915356 RepID=A0ABR2HWX4_9EUKA
MLGVCLEPSSLVFPPTYITNVSRFAVKVINNSNEIHHVSFYSRNDPKEEESEKIQLDEYDVNQRGQIMKSTLFKSEVFNIEPKECELFPHSFNQVIVEFTPTIAAQHEITAYVQVDSQEERFSFNMSGFGLPPSAHFSPDSIIVGHVNLDSILDYEVSLVNSGESSVEFSLENKETSNKYTFNPTSGLIPIGGSVKFQIQLIASSVGNFVDTFTFRVRGALKTLPIITFTGKVIGPSYSITPRQIKFGGVGYGFLHTEKLEIENKSEIPFDFKLRMSHDGTFEHREFQILPESGTVNKFGKVEITIEFIPISIRAYNLCLYLDINKFGQRLSEIPITATCYCPSLTLVPNVLDLHDIYINYKYSKTVILKNDTDYAAKFEFVKQNSSSLKLGIIEVGKDIGIVSPHSESNIDLTFTGIKIGKMNIDCFFSIFGSDDPPIKLTIVANCTGPTLDISLKNINFGNVKVLKKIEKTLTISNNSLIPANFKAFFEPLSKVYSIEPNESTILPNEIMNFSVLANLTDTLTFASNLKFQFDNLNPIVIPIKAVGNGTPIVSSIDMETIDFGNILTESPSNLPFDLTNYSDRMYEIRWSNQKPKFQNDQCQLTYSIEPDYVQIRPHEKQTFTITLRCKKVTSFTMVLMCNATVGRSRNEIFQPLLKAAFVQPLITLSTNLIEFETNCIPTETSESKDRSNLQPPSELLTKIEKPISITNKSKITLNLIVDCPDPFKCSQDKITINSGETIDLTIIFDTTFKTDFTSESITRKLQFIFEDFPQKVTSTLKGVINFPNVSFSLKGPIDFGVSMMNTEQAKTLEMKNVFVSPIYYEWELMSDDELANKAFDIYPLRGDLDPGSTIETHIGYFALADPNGQHRNYTATAVCHIYGGPDYQFPLNGSSASLDYRIEPLNFELGERNFSEEVIEKLRIFNISKVPLKFEMKIPRRTKFNSFQISPISGEIEPKKEQEIVVRIVPGLPQEYQESFTVQIGGFEDIQVHVSVDAQYSQISMPLPRDETDLALTNINSEIEKKESLSLQRKETNKENQIKLNPNKQEEEEENEFNDQQQDKNEISLDLLLKEERLLLNEHIKNSSNLPQFIQNQQPFYVAKYVFNFGEMILGEQRKETIPITNHTSFPISFDVNLDKLKRTGFKIEPMSYKDIQGKTTVNIDIIFNPMIRRINDVGPVSYLVPITFNDGHSILLIIKANLKLPELSFSNFHFEFGSVVIGQTKIMTLQLQNMNDVSCEFKFGQAESVNILQKNSQQQNSSNVFIVVPDSGILPPSSFMNIAIHFTPDSEKSYQMQFPLMLKYALTPSYITVDGKGLFLQLTFDPTELFMETIQPFSLPVTSEVTVTNPTDYQIEFFSLQFDKELINENIDDPRRSESPFVTYTPKIKTPASASKFAICIIVSGTPLSGKTTISKHLSQVYNIPIIDLKEVWKEKEKENVEIEEEEDTNEEDLLSADCVKELYSLISKPEYRSGFIIDGLNCIDETSSKENETFASQCLKVKNAHDEMDKVIPQPIAHQQLSSYEKALDYVLNSLDGHYVFHVSLKTSLDVGIKRRDSILRREKGIKKHQLKEEKDRLFNMTEEEYENLSPEEKEKVDKKRSSYRNKLVDQPEETTEKSHKKGKSHGKHSESKKDIISTSRSTSSQKQEKEKEKDKKKSKSGLPSDPLEQEYLIYSLSLGSLIQKIQSATDRFKVLDPLEIIEFNKDEINHSINSVLINADESREKIVSQITSFLPLLTTLKESAFKLLIPEPVVQDVAKTTELMKMPRFFSIVTDEENESKLTQRWKLNPKEQMTLTVQFESIIPGNFIEDLLFQICSSSSQPTSLKVHGNCFLPDFERSPKALFPSLLRKFDPKQTPAFITETNELNFGYVLTCKERTGKAQMMYHTTVNLYNTTCFPCEVTCLFTDPALKNIWGVDQTTFTIPPSQIPTKPAETEKPKSKSKGSKEKEKEKDEQQLMIDFQNKLNTYSKSELVIGFNPTAPNIYRTSLILLVKDNPEPLSIKLVGECAVPSVDISSLSIDFDKVLINTEKVKKIELKNNGKLTAFWQIKGTSSLNGLVTFNQTEGLIQSRSSFIIIVKFQSTKPQQLKKALQFEVTDEAKTKLFRNETLQVAGEAFDVNFDITVPKVGTEQLDFGQLKVGQSKTLQIQVKNKGKYPVQFKFTFSDKTVAKYLTMSPMEGTSPVNDKGTTINVTFNALNVVKFQSQKGINLKVIETQTNTITANQSFTFCAKTFYNTFNLSCGKKVDFGINNIGNIMKKEFTLTNTGVFPFDYEFQTKSTQEESKSGMKALNSAKVKTLTSKTKAKPKQSNVLCLGPFSISPTSGVVQPNSTVNFSIEFMSNEIGNFKENFRVSIPDVNSADSNYLVRLIGNSFQPSLELTDNEKIFPKLPLLIRTDLLKKDITCYLEDEKVLHFSPLLQGSSESVPINFYNPQPIECITELSIKSKAKINPFELKEKTIKIPANSNYTTNITFTPPGCDGYSSSFEAVVKSQSPLTALKFGLEGVGSIPAITLKSPLDKSKNGFLLNLGKTLIGYEKKKTVAIGNDTPLTAMVSVSAKATADFEIEGIDSSKPFPIESNRQFNFTVIHKPLKVRKSQFDISIQVEDNPKSSISFNCIGDGYSEDIIFEGLEGEDAELHFRDAVVGRSQSVTFTMKNVCESAVRFSWSASSDITFSPRVGHISKNQSKEITAVFYSEKPTKYNGVKGSCQFTKIELIDNNEADWDDSMKVVSFVPINEALADSPRSTASNSSINSLPLKKDEEVKMMKVTTAVAEPPYNPIANAKARDLPIKIFAISDNIKCTIDTTEISFAPTMMFQTRTSDVKITNACQIRLEYTWIVQKFESLRSDYSLTRPSCFSIEPSTGFIEAGQSTTFHVLFSPMEVDDFICTMKCNIPFLTSGDPPIINMNGLSRRPLCHFNVKVSDYLSRRHPDFTYELPDNVKVIELFSKGPKAKTVFKLEIINPTSAPYDTYWTMINDNSNGSINIENATALISSGKHYMFLVSFLPNSAKLVESLWEFNIPDHGIKIPFLFVGRITH